MRGDDLAELEEDMLLFDLTSVLNRLKNPGTQFRFGYGSELLDPLSKLVEKMSAPPNSLTFVGDAGKIASPPIVEGKTKGEEND